MQPVYTVGCATPGPILWELENGKMSLMWLLKQSHRDIRGKYISSSREKRGEGNGGEGKGREKIEERKGEKKRTKRENMLSGTLVEFSFSFISYT